MKEIYKNIYTFPTVLPKSPLKAINIYIIKGKDRALMLDTGFNMPETKAELLAGLDELGLKVEDVDLFVTHLHSDHSGLASMFAEAGSIVYASELDGKLINEMANGKYWSRMMDWLEKYGISSDEVGLTDNPGYLHRLDEEIDFKFLKAGDRLRIDDFDFEVLDLEGHTPGHIGLYERDKKILFCADTILDIITPNITFWGLEYGDMLGKYMNTIKKLKDLDVDHCLSTHRKIVDDHRKRIDEIIEHHFERLEEIMNSMEDGKKYTIREIASNISWRIKADSWDDFPAAQKYFASGETMAHVYYLAMADKLQMEDTNNTLYFTKK